MVAPSDAPSTSAAGAVGALRWARLGPWVASKSSTCPAAPRAATRSETPSPSPLAARAAGSPRPPAAHASQSRSAVPYTRRTLIVRDALPEARLESVEQALEPVVEPLARPERAGEPVGGRGERRELAGGQRDERRARAPYRRLLGGRVSLEAAGPEGVPAQRPPGAGGLVRIEPRILEDAQASLGDAQRTRREHRAGEQRAEAGWIVSQRGPGVVQERDDLLPPAARAGLRERDVLCGASHHRVEQLILVAEVAVDAHGPDVELLCEPAHAQAFEAILLDDRERGLDDSLPREPVGPGLSATRHLVYSV